MRVSQTIPTETGTHVALWIHNGHLFTAQLYKPENREMQLCIVRDYADRRIPERFESGTFPLRGVWEDWVPNLYNENINFTYLTKL